MTSKLMNQIAPKKGPVTSLLYYSETRSGVSKSAALMCKCTKNLSANVQYVTAQKFFLHLGVLRSSKIDLHALFQTCRLQTESLN